MYDITLSLEAVQGGSVCRFLQAGIVGVSRMGVPNGGVSNVGVSN